MKIYLQVKDECKLFSKNLKKEFKKRNITIGNSATIGDYATIGNSATIGDYATIGDFATIGNSATIGYSATIGNSATIGDYATIGNNATIGDFATINKNITDDVYNPSYIYCQTGILMQGGIGVFYKAVSMDLKSNYSGYTYTIGSKDKINMERDQNIDCGKGFHFTGLWDAIGFGKQSFGNGKYKIISAKIKLDDILAVHSKIRVREYSNVKLVTDIDL